MPFIDTQKAAAVLQNNDRGGYTVPTHGLYPFQWSWDSAITALGWMRFDEERAWQEADTMFRGQWDNGMIPHILFHKDAESYFPGPDVWGGNQVIPSSAISQPPVWATVIRLLYEQSGNRNLAIEKVNALMPGLIAYHQWWYSERDPDGTGLVCSFHPWESGMDNSPAWDDPLERVPEIDWSYQRRDLSHVDSEQRPKKPEYDRYLYLVDFYKQHNFDSGTVYRDCPYRLHDIGIISILHRATQDLIELCRITSQEAEIHSLQSKLAKTDAAIDSLWSDKHACFLNRDMLTGRLLEEITTGTVMPLFGGLASHDQASAMADLIEKWLDGTSFGLSSTHPMSSRYEPQRYWRGPVWIHINWMISQGLHAYGYPELGERIRRSSQEAVGLAGFWEYFDADTGAGCGGDAFSWTAAMAIYWLSDN